MIDNFRSYAEFESSYKFIVELLNICQNRIIKLEEKFDHGNISYAYYTFEKQRYNGVCEEARKLEWLKDNILKNQKTNKEMIEIILEYAKRYQCYRSQNYSIRIVKDIDKKDISGTLTKDYKFENIQNSNVYYLVLLVKNIISNDKLGDILNDTKKYKEYIDNGDIICIDRVKKLNCQANINTYLENKTINIDKIDGLSITTKEFIKEKLFADYVENYHKKETEWHNTKKKVKKEEQ